MTFERSDLTPMAIGFCITVTGVVMLLHNFGVLDAATALRYWPVGLVLIGGAMMWSSLHGGRTTVSIGAIFWLVVLGAVLNYTFARRQTADERLAPSQVNLFAVLGTDKRPPLTGHFSGGKLTAVWGGTYLDLRQASLGRGEEAVIDVFTMMGGGTIRVPPAWSVEVDASAIAGGIRNRASKPLAGVGAGNDLSGPAGSAGVPEATAPAPRLVVRGAVIMGGLTIQP